MVAGDGPPPSGPVALTVAGSDSGGGAGIQADLRTFAAFGVWGAVAVTAVTAQNDRGVLACALMSPDLVAAQMDAVAAMGPVAAVKTGMLGDAGVIDAVGRSLDRHDFGPLVVDPVLSATAGGTLLRPDALPVLEAVLLPKCALFTPNIPEAEAFLGRPILGRDDMPAAAAALAERGPGAVLLKGGHLPGPESPDLLWLGGAALWLEGPRLEVGRSHGTGCTLSAAITAGLATGTPLLEACRAAKEFVRLALSARQPAGPHPSGKGG